MLYVVMKERLNHLHVLATERLYHVDPLVKGDSVISAHATAKRTKMLCVRGPCESKYQ